MKYKALWVLCVLICLVAAKDVSAHKVIVFAWVEDGMIHTESSFGSKKKAKDCPIQVIDEKGTVVHEGVTDDQGNYVFKIPDQVDSDLVIRLDAGTGHSATWKLSHDELVTPGDENHLAASMEEKQKFESGPSPLKIMGGIGIIFLLALLTGYLRKKKKTHD
ncbi:MAG: hypothetical protein KKE62_09795 [Proteobacteria bacterium]|nr:hypothetical protein [Pseudomonadota bacterium]MBU1388779.1 hypothetical protein [Pseudomonadota bacterium]MBU1543120.1 hypothetical protein [Pseudomonadota bacterium]MBU2430017.1 hypothetical protein [Pseudomonadota bacterium]MBU2481710.1 hypothetical protein [Pseudomonadota bacterium]